jgi:hypothetical protein
VPCAPCEPWNNELPKATRSPHDVSSGNSPPGRDDGSSNGARPRRGRFAFETEQDRGALERFAARLERAGAAQAQWPLRFSWNRLPSVVPDPSFPIRRRRLLAFQGDEIRGAVNFFEHQLWFAGSAEPSAFVWPNGMITEGVVDRRYATIGPALLRAALARQPRQMVLGPIGTEAPMAKLLIAHRWSHQEVPVLALPLRSARVVRELRRLSRYPKLQIAAGAAAALGLTSVLDLGLTGLRYFRQPRDLSVDEVDRFESWSDAVWDAARPSYGALTRRDGAALDCLFRPGDPRLVRLKISRGSRLLGWVALTVRDYSDDPDFGNLHTGVLADCLAPPAEAAAVIAAGVRRLAAMGVDLIVATFSHSTWVAESRHIGFVPVPTTTRLFVSPALAPLLPQLSSLHLTRGDCDGPLPYKKAGEANAR